MAKPVLRTKLCDMFGIEYPIILAGMGGVYENDSVSRSDLVAAVSNAGGLGIIGASAVDPKSLREEIRKVRKLTDKPFGVDILFPAAGAHVEDSVAEIKTKLPKEHVNFMNRLHQQLNVTPVKSPEFKLFSTEVSKEQWGVIVSEGVDIIALGLGTPDWLIPEAHSKGIKVIALVGNVRQARRLAGMDVDLIVAQGHEAGGHTGRIGLMALLPQVVAVVSPTPVVAAGGIVDGSQVAAALAMGAIGVWVGTAFEATHESPLPEQAKQAIIKANEESPRVTRVFTGKTARVIYGPLAQAWEEAGISPLPMPEQNYLMQDFLYAAQQQNRHDIMMTAAGQGAGKIEKIKSARQVLDEMVEGAVRTLTKELPANVAAK